MAFLSSHCQCNEGCLVMTTKAEILHAIRGKCMDCSGYQTQEVRFCPVSACPLHAFRSGKDPHPSRGRGFAKTLGYTGENAEEKGKS